RVAARDPSTQPEPREQRSPARSGQAVQWLSLVSEHPPFRRAPQKFDRIAALGALIPGKEIQEPAIRQHHVHRVAQDVKRLAHVLQQKLAVVIDKELCREVTLNHARAFVFLEPFEKRPDRPSIVEIMKGPQGVIS
ncbi:MAG TPA: hypothetical protein VIJ06_02155, partial [Methylovirgula sp.]